MQGPLLAVGLCVAVGGRRCATALQPDLVGAQPPEVGDEEVLVELEAAVRFDVRFDHPRADSVGIELVVPGSVERIREVEMATIAADLDHLRPTAQGLRSSRVRRTADDATDVK